MHATAPLEVNSKIISWRYCHTLLPGLYFSLASTQITVSPVLSTKVTLILLQQILILLESHRPTNLIVLGPYKL